MIMIASYMLPLFEDYIFEAKLSLEEIHEKFYSQMELEEFMAYAKLDPTSYKEGESEPSVMGRYVKWIIDRLVKNGVIDYKKGWSEQTSKEILDALESFDEFKQKLEKKDIFQYNTPKEVFDAVRRTKEKVQKAKADFDPRNTKEANFAGQYKEIYKNEDYRLIVPFTLKASEYFGNRRFCKTTSKWWCTTSSVQWNKYTRNMDIYAIEAGEYDNNMLIIFSPRKKGLEMYQINTNSKEFADVTNSRSDLGKFLQKYPDIAEMVVPAINFEITPEDVSIHVDENIEISQINKNDTSITFDNKFLNDDVDGFSSFYQYGNDFIRDKHKFDGSFRSIVAKYIIEKANNRWDRFPEIYRRLILAVTVKGAAWEDPRLIFLSVNNEDPRYYQELYQKLATEIFPDYKENKVYILLKEDNKYTLNYLHQIITE